MILFKIYIPRELPSIWSLINIYTFPNYNENESVNLKEEELGSILLPESFLLNIKEMKTVLSYML